VIREALKSKKSNPEDVHLMKVAGFTRRVRVDWNYLVEYAAFKARTA
jgi:hypothetical protein